MPNKKVSSTISQDFLVVKLLMATFVIGVFFNLYLFAVHPPWMEQIHSFFESDTVKVSGKQKMRFFGFS